MTSLTDIRQRTMIEMIAEYQRDVTAYWEDKNRDNDDMPLFMGRAEALLKESREVLIALRDGE